MKRSNPVMTREEFIDHWILKENAADLTTRSNDAVHLTVSLRHKHLRLRAEDLSLGSLSDPTQHGRYLEFLLQVAQTHPRFTRKWNPSLWDAGARAIWEDRCRPASLPLTQPHISITNTQILAFVKTLDDLDSFFDQLVGVWEYIPPEFLSTRPSYMKKHGDQAEPCVTTYLALFESFFTSPAHLGILLASPAERTSFFARFESSLPRLTSLKTRILQMWYTYGNTLYQKQRSVFKRKMRQFIIAEAMKPQRISWILEHHGIDALDMYLSN